MIWLGIWVALVLLARLLDWCNSKKQGEPHEW